MSAKENSHKLKYEGRRRSSSSCISCCFSASPIYESDDLDSTLASLPEPKDQEKTSWFSWGKRRKKKKKKVMLVSINDSMKFVPASQGDHKDKLHKTKSNQPRTGDSQAQHHQQRLKLNTNTASQSPSLPKISAKYGTRSLQAAVPTSSTPDTVRTRTRTKHPLPLHAENSDRHATLDPVFGLLVLGFTLAVMLTCGRACAIACLCACFYLLPLLKTAAEVTDGESRERRKSYVQLDMESEEYKKKVVLEGLLERNGRRLNSGKAPSATEIQ